MARKKYSTPRSNRRALIKHLSRMVEGHRPSNVVCVTGLTSPRDGCDSFVYIWKNLNNGRWYVGMHKDTDKAYFTSSTNQDFHTDMSDPNIKWELEILAWGSVKECYWLESEAIESRGGSLKEGNLMSYNFVNNARGRGVKPFNHELVNQLHKELDLIRCKKIYIEEDFKYLDPVLSIETSGVKVIYERKKIQTRATAIDTDNLNNIMWRVQNRDPHGYDRPVFLKDVTYKGKHYDYLLISGNHTRTAYFKLKYKSKNSTTLMNPQVPLDLECVIVPSSITEGMSDAEIRMLSNHLNGASKNAGKPFSREDGVKELKQMIEDGHAWKSPDTQEMLTSRGLSPGQIKSVFADVQDYLLKEEKRNAGVNIPNYEKDDDAKKMLNDTVAGYEAQDYFVWSGSSANPTLDRWLGQWAKAQAKRLKDGLPIQTKIKVVVYHPTYAYEDSWPKRFKKYIVDMDELHDVEENYNQIKSTLGLPSITYHEMPIEIDDVK